MEAKIEEHDRKLELVYKDLTDGLLKLNENQVTIIKYIKILNLKVDKLTEKIKNWD